MANRFLTESASEMGTNDAILFDDRVRRAMVTSSTYIEGWVDRTGGGYIPLQIKAHPLAVDPSNPLVGPDGMPTTDYVLRYVTAEGPNGEPAQFTEDASQAAPQWQPKIMASAWERTHLRVFPEDKPVHLAEKVIILGYCTIAEGKRRWVDVANMAPADLNALCDWTPQRFLVLLPPFQRARWKITDGREKEKAGSSDERIFFYYHILQRATPDYPKGADVVVTGAKGGLVLSRELLASEVEVNKGQGKTKELRCREIPVVQVTPRGDPNGRDPSGLAFLEQFVGATENNATLAMGFAENIDKINHTPFAVPSTSPIEGWQVEDARATGDMLIVTTKEDMPQQLETPQLPSAFFNMYELSDEAINSIAAQERAAQGSENSQERSGKALQIAISRNNVANTPMLTPVNNAVARWNRIKLELAMAYYTTPQLIRYEGEDGAYKQDEFSGVDFALVGKVSIKAGTGTMMPPGEKVNYLGNLRANAMIDDDETREAARPAFAKQLGLSPNPHEQYVERCLQAWLKGPPEGWMPPQPQIDPMTGQPAINPQTGQPAMAPASWTPFQPRPNDTEPRIAAIWMRKLSDAMSTVKYDRYRKEAPQWVALFDQQYMTARQAVALAQAAAQPKAPAPHPSAASGKSSGPQPTNPTKPQTPQRPDAAGAHPEIPRGVAA
jgi:hypothetical protein